MYIVKKVRRVITALLILMLLIILLIYSEECSEGIIKGLKNCYELLIPSLFPYMLLSGLIMYTGTDRYIGKIFSPVVKILFNLPGESAAAVILSLVGGYPIGAKCIDQLYKEKKIDLSQAQRMSMFCVCPGPAFMITAIGTLMLKNSGAGIILYFSQIISAIIIGLAVGIISRKESLRKKIIKGETGDKTGPMSFVTALIKACTDASAAVISMTSLVAIFSMLINVMELSNVTKAVQTVFTAVGAGKRETAVFIPVLTEVTAGCTAIKNEGLPLWWFSAAAGFGGLCVHFQIFAILRETPVPRKKYILFRVLNAVLSGIVCYIICKLFPMEEDVFSMYGGRSAEISSSTSVGSIALIIMCAVFLMSVRFFAFQSSRKRKK